MYETVSEEVSKIPFYYLLIVVMAIVVANLVIRKMVGYHWDEYGYDDAVSSKIKKRIFNTSYVLLAIMGISLIIYYLA